MSEQKVEMQTAKPEKTQQQPASNRSRVIMRRIWDGWIRLYLARLIWAFLLMAIVAGTASAYPLLTRYIFNVLADAAGG